MPAQLGRTLLIRIGDGETPSEAFANLCGIKTRTFNLSANEIDTTYPDCENPAAAVQRTARPGVVNRTFSGSGTFVSGGTQAILMGHVREATLFQRRGRGSRRRRVRRTLDGVGVRVRG